MPGTSTLVFEVLVKGSPLAERFRGYEQGPLEGTLNLVPHIQPLYIPYIVPVYLSSP